MEMQDKKKRYLTILLSIVYFGVISSYALVWRWLLRRGLMKSRGGWATIAKSTDTPDVFNRTA